MFYFVIQGRCPPPLQAAKVDYGFVNSGAESSSEQFFLKNCSAKTPDISGVFDNVEQLEQFFGAFYSFFINLPFVLKIMIE